MEGLRSKIEADYDRYLRRSGVDWRRPPKPGCNSLVNRRGTAIVGVDVMPSQVVHTGLPCAVAGSCRSQ